MNDKVKWCTILFGNLSLHEAKNACLPSSLSAVDPLEFPEPALGAPFFFEGQELYFYYGTVTGSFAVEGPDCFSIDEMRRLSISLCIPCHKVLWPALTVVPSDVSSDVSAVPSDVSAPPGDPDSGEEEA
jgi:hypothetical protein